MIPVNRPLLGAHELDYVTECVRTGWISSAGEYIQAFEARWAEYCGMSYGVAVSSGTAALQLAVACLDLEPGDEVIMPSFTIISCAQAVVYNGGLPVLVDSDPQTWCMDAGQIKARITPRTRAIMAVHIYGHPVDMDPVLNVAEDYDLSVIEDAAEAHGANYLSNRDSEAPEWRRCGGLGNISTFSFYANKPITTGEGGMLLTNSLEIAEKARSLRNLCFDQNQRFRHERLGHNFRLTNVQAAMGLAQVERVEEIIARKRQIGEVYNQRFRGLEGVQLPIEKPWAKQIYWMYGLVLEDRADMEAAEFAARLSARGIQTRPFFLGMHEQPSLRDRGYFAGESYPIAERLARRGLYLPSGLGLTEAEQDQVCEVVGEVLS